MSKVNVVKIPNENIDVVPSKKQNFPRMPRMYLELLENKDKVKPTLMNQEYDPNDADTVASFYTNNEREDPFEQREDPFEQRDNMDVIEEEESENEQDDDEISEVTVSEKSDNDDEISNDGDNSENESDDENSLTDRSSTKDSILSKEESEKNETKNKLKQLLQQESEHTPKLSDLEKQGKVRPNLSIPDYSNMEKEDVSEEDEEDLKRELLFKFELLKKSYKNVEIPEFTVHSSLKKMNETYENLLRHVSLDSSVESYKNILVGGFMIFEFIFGVWLKFDMSGFTQQQILNMSQYERLLIELGEKSYVPEGKQWPIEIRLIGLIVLNAVIFIISKMILKKTGSNLMGMMNHVQQQAPVKQEAPKKKMRGPSISIDDI